MKKVETVPWVFKETGTGERREVRIGAVCSVPRLAFSTHWGSLNQAFDGMQIPVIKVTGYGWGACLQRGINVLIESGCDYIITIDYDSVFHKEDVLELLLLAARHEDADAILPWQVRRGGYDELLVLVRDGNGIPVKSITAAEVQDELVAVAGGHFGLTLIKTSALLNTPKPWFWDQPNEHGEWEDGKTDADIYFWNKFREAGHKACLATNIRIGHIDENILWPNAQFGITRQNAADYHEKGKPELELISGYNVPTGNCKQDTRFIPFIASIEPWNHTSQFGEDSIINAIFNRIGTENKWCFECGASDGLFFSNTRKLIEDGWMAIQVEADPVFFEQLSNRYKDHPRVRCVQQFVGLKPGNRLDDILQRLGAPQDIDLLVIDVDGQDYHLWNSLTKYRPRVLCVEFAPGDSGMFIPEPGEEGKQAGLHPLHYMAKAKGYTPIVATHCNLICVPNELAHLLEETNHANEEYRKTESEQPSENRVSADGAGGVARRAGAEA